MPAPKSSAIEPSGVGTARRLARVLAMPTLLFAIVVLFNWKLVLTHQYSWMESPDLAHQVLPWFQFQASEWHQFRFPMWEPSGWGGQPLFGQGQPGAAYPLNWLLFLMPLNNGWIREEALNWYIVLIRYLAALAMYALCRDLGRSRAASIFGGCLYGLGGYVATTLWPQMINGAVWSPLVFLFLFRAVRPSLPSSSTFPTGEPVSPLTMQPWAAAVLSGFCLGTGWLAGHHQMNLYVSLAVAGLWAWLIIEPYWSDPDWSHPGEWRGPSGLRRWIPENTWTRTKLAAISMAVAIPASAFQTFPMAEYGARALRWVGSPQDPVAIDQNVPYFIHELYALKPASLLGIFIPNVEWGWIPYIGIAGFALALTGAILSWRLRTEARWLAATATAGMLFSLGPNSLLHGLMYTLVPLVEESRVPGAATLLFAIGAAPLAAFGLDLLPRPEFAFWSRRATAWLTGTGAVAAILGLIFFNLDLQTYTGDRILVVTVGAFALAAILAAQRAGMLRRAGAALVILIALFELSNVTNYVLPNRASPDQRPYLVHLGEHWDLANFVTARGEAARVYYDDSSIRYNFGDWLGTDAMNQFVASVTANIWSMDLFSERGQDFFGIRYYLAAEPNRETQIEVYQGLSGLKVFENPNALPRVWSVHHAEAVATIGESRDRFQYSEGFDPLETAFLVTEGPAPALETCPPAPGERVANANPDNVQLPFRAGNYVRITADMRCRGLVVLTDTWYPGWQAEIDGERAEILEVYGGVRGVVVDAGRHTIEMRYRPLSVFAGLGLSLAALLLAIWAWRKGRVFPESSGDL